ncbi:S41 family peptidase [Shewanella psychrotolerans]|uniref:S41 family peptidase n=1 Tax=Shewanella psychrotolerans TaxID=2864206 RepID=UPI001C65506F|nr:S41 family peptidase [Shewanella psychrotolerans]QYK02015.1 hypothetical protein K0I62_03300 [Shewanella psychrotolerans]
MMKFGHQTIINGFGLIMLISCIQLTFIALRSEPPKALLSQQEIHTDLVLLEQKIATHSSLAAIAPQHFEQFKKRAMQVANSPRTTINRGEFAIQLLKVLAPLDDISSRVSNIRAKQYLPITLRQMDGGWLALNRNDEPLDADFPFITHIDGLPLKRWVAASQQFLPPSIQSVATEQAKILRMLSILRQEIGISSSETVRLTLSDQQQHIRQLSLAVERNIPRALQPSKTTTNFNNTPEGFFSFNDLSQFTLGNSLEQSLKRSLFSPITILDLRHAYGNGEQLLAWLASYYSPAVAAPLSGVNLSNTYAIARYRRAANVRGDYLTPMNFVPYDSLSRQDQYEVDLTEQQIETQFDDGFSQWHVRKWQQQALPLHLLPQPKPGKLILLIGPGCRQQCQWIAHFAKQWPKTVLIGEPTRGDFGKHHHFKLPSSGITVAITSSIIFDMVGQRLSGVPTKPDIELPIDEILYWQGILALVNAHNQTSSH